MRIYAATSDQSLAILSWSIYESGLNPKTMLTADLYPWTFSLAKGFKWLQSLAQRSSPRSLCWLWRSSRVQDGNQDEYMIGRLANQTSIRISDYFAYLLCPFDFRSVDWLWPSLWSWGSSLWQWWRTLLWCLLNLDRLGWLKRTTMRHIRLFPWGIFLLRSRQQETISCHIKMRNGVKPLRATQNQPAFNRKMRAWPIGCGLHEANPLRPTPPVLSWPFWVLALMLHLSIEGGSDKIEASHSYIPKVQEYREHQPKQSTKTINQSQI